MTQSFQELLTTNYGLLPSGYTGSQGVAGYTGSAAAGGPKITNLQVTDSSYTVLDDTAVDLAGGYVKLTGSGFASGCIVMINNVPATSTTFVGDTEVRAQVPATAAGTYVVYLVNTDGGVAIRVNGITFSATPAWSTSSALPTGVDGTAVSIQLAAAGASTYSLAAGSTLPGTLTVSSSGLISGIVSGLTNETTYSFTVIATDTELQDSPRTFSITITAGDAYFNSTTLLLSGSANTFVKDASTNNFAVTVAGDTKPTNFNPYLTGWSNLFDGTGDYLSVGNNSALNLSGGDFTVEAWIYLTALPALNADNNRVVSILVYSATTANQGYSFNIDLTGNTINMQSPASANWARASFTFALGTWYHVAATRSGSTDRLFVNGQLLTLTANLFPNNSSATGTLKIGSERLYANYNHDFPGYISNVRIVKGTAVYTAAFTPPIQPLTAVAGTSLLTCADNRFIDESANNFTLTAVGDTKIQSFSPFVETATTRGSAYFDGTGDLLTISGNTAFEMGSGDFTAECWFNATSNNDGGLVFKGQYQTGEAWLPGFGIRRMSATQIRFYFNTSSTLAGEKIFDYTVVTNLNTWYHVAMVVSSGVGYAFVNGTLVNPPGTSGVGAIGTSATGITIGAFPFTSINLHFTGYLSNVRIVKGTAVYTTAFTPPTQPLTAVANTSLLTLQNNTPVANNTFLDSSSNNFVVTRAGNTTQGTFSPYSPSGWSAYFDGTGDYLTIPYNSNIDLIPGSWTFECWVFPTATKSASRIFSTGGGTIAWNSTTGIHILIVLSNTNLVGVQLATGTGSPTVLYNPTTVNLNTWNHIAACVDTANSKVRMFLNGVMAESTYTSYSRPSTNPVATIGTINGEAGDVNTAYQGNISNLRIVKGTAIYTANFTPSTTPLTAIAGTSLLTCADNRFIDESPNNFAITGTGDTRVTNFSPFKAVVQTPTTYSGYFDGTGRISAPAGTAFAYGTGAFTIEAWVNTSAYGGAVFAQTVTGANYFLLSITATGAVELRYGAGGGTVLTTAAGVVSLNTWTHVALVREGTGSNQFKIYVNGVVSLTGTLSYSFDNTTYNPSVGNYSHSTSDGPYYGYISNVRVVKGTAVYTAAFTPSTTPLTAVTNTSWLTCQSATFVDNSTNKFAITAVGNSRPGTVNPFGSTFVNSTGYTAAEYSGSAYFDGTGDYLTLPSNAAFAFGTGDFTVECWAYFTSVANFPTLTDGRSSTSSTAGFNLGLSGAKVQLYTTSQLLIGATTVVANTWCHIAVTRSGTTLRIWLNGVQDATVSNSANWSDTTFLVGAPPAAANYMTGYISNLRVIKGQALYTSNFVPPLAPVLPIANTTLLLNGTAAAITDATTKTVVETVGDAKISTAVSKFGGSSIYFDGTGDYLQLRRDEPIGTGDFTIEGWAYLGAVGDAYYTFYGPYPFGIRYANNGFANRLQFSYDFNTAASIYNCQIQSGNGYNQWIHMAWTRASGTNRFFFNGVQQNLGTGSGPSTFPLTSFSNSSSPPTGGMIGDGWVGYIQDFRITRGTARYTANFTPPATAFIAK